MKSNENNVKKFLLIGLIGAIITFIGGELTIGWTVYPEASNYYFAMLAGCKDFLGSEIGIKKSSAQITEVYKPEDLIGKQVLAVVNFPPRQIADFMSEILVLGTYNKDGVVLSTPDKEVTNGDKLG